VQVSVDFVELLVEIGIVRIVGQVEWVGIWIVFVRIAVLIEQMIEVKQMIVVGQVGKRNEIGVEQVEKRMRMWMIRFE
ncbi:7573_t:CDS:1, partial [Cetraspora pellucida]